tara:strand:+ start:26170 stop:26667 length:498 start_codon:yes stop_codon:yes gene_type:complete
MKLLYLLCLSFSKSLVNNNIPLIYHFANKYKSKYNLNYDQYNDIVQEGSLGLIRASEKYNTTKGAKFSTYGSIWIKSYMGKYMKNSYRKRLFPLNEDLITVKYEEKYPELNLDIGLSETEKVILHLRYDRCKSYREISEIIGVRQHTVIKWHKKILLKFKPQTYI